MKRIEVISVRVICPLLLLAGIALIIGWAWMDDTLPALGAVLGASKAKFLLWPGVAFALLGILGFLRGRHHHVSVKSISYPGIRGNIVIELGWVEATLNRVIGKLREVKWISVTVDPDEDRSKASVRADVKLVKSTEESAKEIANRVSERLADTAANLLGVDDVTRVDLIVKGGGLRAAATTASATPQAPAAEAEEPTAPVDEPGPEPEQADTADTAEEPAADETPAPDEEAPDETESVVEKQPDESAKNEDESGLLEGRSHGPFRVFSRGND